MILFITSIYENVKIVFIKVPLWLINKQNAFRDRSNSPEVFCKKGVLRNFAKFTGKHVCQSFFFSKVAGLSATLLKKRLWHRCFPANFAKFLGTLFFAEHLWWLLLQRGFEFFYKTFIEVSFTNNSNTCKLGKKFFATSAFEGLWMFSV